MKIEGFYERRFHGSEAELAFMEGPANGAPLILIHGLGSRWQPFMPLLAPFAENFHVYALDLRGHGRSGHTPGAYRLTDFARDVHELIAGELGQAAAVYGHSLGALVGIVLSAQYPRDVRSLVLSDPPIYQHDTHIKDTPWQADFQELLDFMLAHPDPREMLVYLEENYPNMSPERWEERVRSLETLDPDVVRFVISNEQVDDVSFADLVRQIECPVMMLKGEPELGSAVRPQDVEFSVKNFKHFRLLEIPGCGHHLVPLSHMPHLIDFIGSAE